MLASAKMLDASWAADQLVVNFVRDLELGGAWRTSATMLDRLNRLQMAVDELSLDVGTLDLSQLIRSLRLRFGKTNNLEWAQSELVDKWTLSLLILVIVFHLISILVLLLQQKLGTTDRSITIRKVAVKRLRIGSRLLLVRFSGHILTHFLVISVILHPLLIQLTLCVASVLIRLLDFLEVSLPLASVCTISKLRILLLRRT